MHLHSQMAAVFGKQKASLQQWRCIVRDLGKGLERLRFMDAYEVLWLSVWRATYDPHRERWTLKFVGSIDWIDLDWAK